MAYRSGEGEPMHMRSALGSGSLTRSADEFAITPRASRTGRLGRIKIVPAPI
jgi:hypothetical protein